MDDMTAKFVDEVKLEVGVRTLEPVVDWAFEAARCKGFKVLHIPPDGNNAPCSSVNWSEKKIYLSPCGAPRIARLWDLLHELGHVFQGQPPAGYAPSKTTESYDREKDAWERGWREATNASPQLAQFEGAYRAHACNMLQSYRPDPVN